MLFISSVVQSATSPLQGKHTVMGLLAALLSVLAIFTRYMIVFQRYDASSAATLVTLKMTQTIVSPVIYWSFFNLTIALVHPSQHTYPSPGLQSVNGSDPTGGCTDPIIFHGIGLCRLGNSSLVDGSIPTLPLSLVGVNNWAAGLFTVNRSGKTSIEIGFELSTSICLIQVELELFNCPEWGIAAPNITVYTWVTFPGLLPSPRAIATRLGGVTTLTSTSCNSITRVLIPLQQSGSAQFYYLEFTFDGAPSVQWVHLAEVRFFDSIPPPIPTTSSTGAPTGIQCCIPTTCKAVVSMSIGHTSHKINACVWPLKISQQLFLWIVLPCCVLYLLYWCAQAPNVFYFTCIM